MHNSQSAQDPAEARLPRRVYAEADRDRIRAFFDANADDSTGFPVLSRSDDRALGIPGLYRIIDDDEGNIVAAIYASANPEDAVFWRQRGRPDLAAFITTQMLIVHTVAVAPVARRRGVGSTLVRAVLDDARGSGASVVALAFDDSSRGLESFYAGLGFTVLARRVNLALSFAGWPDGALRFPQDNPTYRWAAQIVKFGAAQIEGVD